MQAQWAVCTPETATEFSAVGYYFARELQTAVEDENAIVTAVTLWEGPVNSVTYTP